MTSKVTESFWKRYAELPEAIQDLAYRNYQVWLANPHYPSLLFKIFRHKN